MLRITASRRGGTTTIMIHLQVRGRDEEMLAWVSELAIWLTNPCLLAEEDIFDFFEMFFFRGRAPNFQRKGAKAHAGAKSRGGVFPPGTCPCGKPGCTGGMPPMFGNPFFFTGPGGPSGRGGWRPAPKGTTGRGRSNHEYYDDEDYDDDDDDSIYSDDLDGETFPCAALCTWKASHKPSPVECGLVGQASWGPIISAGNRSSHCPLNCQTKDDALYSSAHCLMTCCMSNNAESTVNSTQTLNPEP